MGRKKKKYNDRLSYDEYRKILDEVYSELEITNKLTQDIFRKWNYAYDGIIYHQSLRDSFTIFVNEFNFPVLKTMVDELNKKINDKT